MATLSGTHQITPSSRRSDVIIMAQPLPYGIRCWGAKTNGIIWTNKGNVITRCAFWKAERFDAEHNNAAGGKFTRSGISRENRAGRYLKINSRRRAKINPIVYRTVFTIGTPKYIFFFGGTDGSSISKRCCSRPRSDFRRDRTVDLLLILECRRVHYFARRNYYTN